MSDTPPTEPPTDSPTEPPPDHPRIALLGRLLRFQYRLALDGLRDLLLVPVSIAAVAWGLVRGGDHPERWFDDLCRFGRRSDVWINLFGSHGRRPESEVVLAPVERVLREEYARNPHLQRAGVTLEDLLGRLRRDTPEPPPPSGD